MTYGHITAPFAANQVRLIYYNNKASLVPTGKAEPSAPPPPGESQLGTCQSHPLRALFHHRLNPGKAFGPGKVWMKISRNKYLFGESVSPGLIKMQSRDGMPGAGVGL